MLNVSLALLKKSMVLSARRRSSVWRAAGGIWKEDSEKSPMAEVSKRSGICRRLSSLMVDLNIPHERQRC